MKKIFSKLSLVLVLSTFLLGGIFYPSTHQFIKTAYAAVASKIPIPIALYEDSLASAISSTATSFTLVRGTDIAGTSLASGTYGFIIDEGTSSQEFVLADCIATVCINAIRGVSPITGLDAVSILQKSHRRGAQIKITDAPILLILKRVINGDDTLVNKISYETHPTFTGDTEIIDKKYVDEVTTAGAPNASTTTKGIVEEATQKEDDDGTTVGGTGAELFVSPGTPGKEKISKIRGETINGATTPQPVLLLNDLTQSAVVAASSVYGDAVATQQRGSKVKPQEAVTSTTVKVYLQKFGTPADNLTIEIQSDNAGKPSGTAITNGTSNNVAGSGLTTSAVLTTFTFASPFSLSANTTYWVVAKRSGALDAANYYKIDTAAATTYANFDGAVNNAGTWSAGAVIPYFQIVPVTGQSYSVWLSDANATVLVMRKFTGFVKDNGAAGTNASVTVGSLVPGFSNLTEGAVYYVTDTAGTISTTAGTTTLSVGKAISTTTLFIEYTYSSSGGGVPDFGAPISGLNKNTNYQATTAGILVAFTTADSGAGCTFQVLSDSAAVPTTQLARFTPISAGQFATLTVPVKKNDYYNVKEVTNTATFTINFIPFAAN